MPRSGAPAPPADPSSNRADRYFPRGTVGAAGPPGAALALHRRGNAASVTGRHHSPCGSARAAGRRLCCGSGHRRECMRLIRVSGGVSRTVAPAGRSGRKQVRQGVRIAGAPRSAPESRANVGRTSPHHGYMSVISPGTAEPNAQVGDQAPADTPPTRWETIRIVADATSTKCSPHTSAPQPHAGVVVGAGGERTDGYIGRQHRRSRRIYRAA